jgi:hypothetical protein
MLFSKKKITEFGWGKKRKKKKKKEKKGKKNEKKHERVKAASTK